MASLFGSVTALACERKAPGPAECRALASRWMGVDDESQLLTQRAVAAHEEITRKCLTTPYDRPLVECMVETRDRRRQQECMLAFERRRARRGE